MSGSLGAARISSAQSPPHKESQPQGGGKYVRKEKPSSLVKHQRTPGISDSTAAHWFHVKQKRTYLLGLLCRRPSKK